MLLSILAFPLLAGASCTVPASRCPLTPVTPDSVGMSAQRLAAIERVATRGLDARGFPGMAVVIGHHGGLVWQRGYGSLDWDEDGGGTLVDPERTMYDLASLTKVVATTTAIMVLYDRGRIRLDDPVSKYLPAFRHGDKRLVTIRELLEHRSGLPAGRDVWRLTRSPRAARRLVLSTPLEMEPDSREIYSDLGADVLGFVVEAVTGERLDEFVRRTVFEPLGMTSTMFTPPRRLRSRIAPTEEARGHMLRGEVHDRNAWALGGVAGHAGLFSTASDLAVFAQMMLNGGRYGGVRIVRESTVALFTRRAAGWRALGWETCAGGASCGRYMSERAYGHTGFTGTSIWIDPVNDLFVIVLTNRVHDLPDGGTPPLAVLADVRADIADIAELAVEDGDTSRVMPDELRADLAVGWSR